MRLLLDTHVWVWRLLEPDRVSEAAEDAIAAPESEVHLSPISTWETLALARKGRLELRPSPAEWVLDALRRTAPTAVPLTHGVAVTAERLDGFASSDPADRFLVSSALEYGLTLITADRAMQRYDAVSTIW